MGTKNKSQNCFHILNGDALLEQFPRDLKGASIVFRECMVDGPVTGNSLKELYQKRSAFFAQTYQVCTPIEYEERIVSEFNKVQKIPNGSEINLWFEDDLFCRLIVGLYVIFLGTAKIAIYTLFALTINRPMLFLSIRKLS